MSADEGGWGIGGYVPVGYEVTPWATLFPGLARPETTSTLKSGYLAKLYMYYFTRLQFGQYLKFIADAVPEYSGNDAIHDDVDLYERSCGSLLTRIEETASTKLPGEAPYMEAYEAVTSYFSALLSSGDPSQRFHSTPVYQNFFTNYEFFVECAYGFILTVQDEDDGDFADRERYYVNSIEALEDPTAVIPKNPFTLHGMLGDAVRAYPVLTPGRGGHWCFFEADGVFVLDTTAEQILTLQPKQDSDGFRCYSAFSFAGYSDTMYPVGLNTIPDNYSGPIRGMPMFYKMPFDFLVAYAGGKASTQTQIRQE